MQEVEALGEHGRGTGTGAGAAKLPKFAKNTSQAVFRRQFETVAEHNCLTCLEKFAYLITALLRVGARVLLYGVQKKAACE